MKNIILFLKNFIQSPQTVGAIAESSQYLAKEICEQINWDKELTIAEFGPGMGPFTKHIINNIKNSSRFFAIEKNPDFFIHLNNKFPKLELYFSDVSNVQSFNKGNETDFIDTIVSGLPWAVFSDDLQDELLTCIYESLKNDGYFSTFTYITGYYIPSGIKFRKKLKNKFSTVTISSIVWKNMLPSIVYHCQK